MLLKYGAQVDLPVSHNVMDEEVVVSFMGGVNFYYNVAWAVFDAYYY